MFYSHEILSSPEHGVATIWLVATLGSRSITRKLNKKAILDVDVPRACNVITNPEAPMALRLQGSLLYGVSRVYSQQCGYTLTDVQAMHDRMRATLKVLPGGGLDPAAGKAKPDQLILQDDPSFIPETNLPGLGIDISALTLEPQADVSRESSFLWTKSPDISQTLLPESFNLQLDLSSDDVLRGLGGFRSESANSGSVQRKDPLRRISASALDDEAGVLLRPDFEFDEDGSIIELSHGRRLAGGHRVNETPRPGEVGNDLSWDYQPMPIDDGDHDIRLHNDPMTPNAQQSTGPMLSPDTSLEDGNRAQNNPDTQQVTTRQSRKATKAVPVDEQTALRNTDLAQINNEYLQNMAAMIKQRLQNKFPAQAKKNAAFWVFGQGIGSVGVGLGASHMLHPLHVFCGDELLASLQPEAKKSKQKTKKRSRSNNEGGDESGSDSDGRRVRARGENEKQIGRGGGPSVHDDVEIGRGASSALRDDHSSQMPWNITASIQSSRHGSSVANIFHGAGSVSDFSSRGMSDSASMHLPGLGRPRSRLTSASPLAGRGFPLDIDALNGLEGENHVYGDFDLSHYLQTEADGDGNVALRDDEGTANPAAEGKARTKSGNLESQLRLTQNQVLESSLDQESVNFLDFMYAQIAVDLGQQEKNDDDDDNVNMVDISTPPRQTSGAKEVAFSSLLAPKETTRTVATHALMHILTLATKGFVEVHQDAYQDLTNDHYGTLYQFGEIHVRLPGM